MLLPIALFADADLHLEALSVAGRFGLKASYDAHYLALADRLGVEFWTADRRLANTISSSLPWVRFVG
jgi:predicted nucleic acid-binding protein